MLGVLDRIQQRVRMAKFQIKPDRAAPSSRNRRGRTRFPVCFCSGKTRFGVASVDAPEPGFVEEKTTTFPISGWAALASGLRRRRKTRDRLALRRQVERRSIGIRWRPGEGSAGSLRNRSGDANRQPAPADPDSPESRSVGTPLRGRFARSISTSSGRKLTHANFESRLAADSFLRSARI